MTIPPTSTARALRATQGGRWSYTNPRELEPPDHAIGRSRGGLTCKIHLVSDGRGRPLNLVLTPANINDTTMLEPVIGGIRVLRQGPGRPRTRPNVVIGDKGYPSRANRAYLAGRGIATRTDKTARNYRAGVLIAATLIWLKTD